MRKPFSSSEGSSGGTTAGGSGSRVYTRSMYVYMHGLVPFFSLAHLPSIIYIYQQLVSW